MTCDELNEKIGSLVRERLNLESRKASTLLDFSAILAELEQARKQLAQPCDICRLRLPGPVRR